MFLKEKKCTKCLKLLPIGDFHKDKTHNDGLRSVCKQCSSEAKSKRYQENKQYYIDKAKEWGKRNPERLRETKRKWRNRPENKVKRRGYYQKNKEYYIIKAKEWQAKNPSKTKEIRKKALAKYRNKPDFKTKSKEGWQHYRINSPEKYKQKYQRANAKRASTIQGRLRSAISSRIIAQLSKSPGVKNYKSKFENIGWTIEQLKSHLEAQFQPGMTWENYGDWHIDHKIPHSYFCYNSIYDEEFKKCWALDNLQPMWAEENWSKNNRYIG